MVAQEVKAVQEAREVLERLVKVKAKLEDMVVKALTAVQEAKGEMDSLVKVSPFFVWKET